MKSIRIKKDKKMVSLFEVARRTGLNKQAIVSILIESGFNVFGNGSFSFLNERQLKVISVFYIKAVNDLFRDSKNNHNKIGSTESENFRKFFLNFTKADDYFFGKSYLTIDQILNSDLDNVLISNFFFRVVYAKPVKSRTQSNFGIVAKKISKKINFKLNRINKDLRAILSPILISNHYHIFTAEEDHLGIKNSFFCFSWDNNYKREAIIDSNIYLKQFSWKNINYL